MREDVVEEVKWKRDEEVRGHVPKFHQPTLPSPKWRFGFTRPPCTGPVGRCPHGWDTTYRVRSQETSDRKETAAVPLDNLSQCSYICNPLKKKEKEGRDHLVVIDFCCHLLSYYFTLAVECKRIGWTQTRLLAESYHRDHKKTIVWWRKVSSLELSNELSGMT